MVDCGEEAGGVTGQKTGCLGSKGENGYNAQN